VACPSHPRLPYKGAASRAGILYEWCALATQDDHIREQRLVLGCSMSGVPQPPKITYHIREQRLVLGYSMSGVPQPPKITI